MISILPIILLSKIFKLLNINYISLNIYFYYYRLVFRDRIFVNLLFGQNYIDSVGVIKLLSFSIIFVFYGVVNEHWYVNNLQSIMLLMFSRCYYKCYIKLLSY